MTANLAQLRKKIRQQRRNLSRKQQQHHQQAVTRLLSKQLFFLKSRRIAIYSHSDGEMHTDQIIRLIHQQKKLCYLPVLFPFQHNKLWFLPYRQNQRLRKNRFGINEPAHIKEKIKDWSIDIIFMPLVAFDTNGNRLGMGGGFYDRTLSAGKKLTQMKKPLLIGLAHELQKTNQLMTNEWDIPLDAVLTEKKLYVFSKALKL